MNVYRGTEVWLHAVSTSALRGSPSAPSHALAAISPGKEQTWRQGGDQGQSGDNKISSNRDSNPDASNPQ